MLAVGNGDASGGYCVGIIAGGNSPGPAGAVTGVGTGAPWLTSAGNGG